MNEKIGNIYTFNTENFTVKIDALIEYDPDLSWDESGEMTAFCAKAYILDYEGNEISSDYLGGCIYKDITDFKDNSGLGYTATLNRYKKAVKAHKWLNADRERRALFLIKKQGFCYGSYFSDMIKTVIKEARYYWNTKQTVFLKEA